MTKEELKNWLNARSKRTKNIIFLFFLIIAYAASIGIMNAENILQYIIGAAIALSLVYLAILVLQNLDESNSREKPNQRKCAL